jgi:glycosyltransferase involved in cell wall biosynthesis
VRIALASQAYPGEGPQGGIASQTYLKAQGLAALGHEVHVIAQSADSTRPRAWEEDGVHIHRVVGFEPRHPPATTAAAWVAYSAQLAHELERLHDRAPLDLVDVPEYGAEGFVHLLNRTEWNWVPTVVQLQGPLVMLAETIGWPELDSDLYRVGTFMEATCVRLADLVYSSSDLSADWAASRYGIDRSRIETLHLGVDTELFQPLPLPKAERPTIVSVGRVARSKGADVLVEAARLAAAGVPGLTVRFVGAVDPDLAHELDGPDVEFAGEIPREELPTELAQAHVFAAPSRYEGGPGLVLLEAAACGLPVVASSGSGALESVLEGETGFLVPPDDAEALADAISRLFSDPELRKRMGLAGRELALERADTRRRVRVLESLYERVVAHPVAS